MKVKIAAAGRLMEKTHGGRKEIKALSDSDFHVGKKSTLKTKDEPTWN